VFATDYADIADFLVMDIYGLCSEGRMYEVNKLPHFVLLCSQ